MKRAAEPGNPLRARFEAAMGSLFPPKTLDLAVACSGGPDSMALTMLANEWAQKTGVVLHPVIVDHALRTESAAEAKTVAERLRDLGLNPTILSHLGPKPGRNTQAAAREIRYGLINDWMRGQGITHLALGHHLEDQAETVLMRLTRGSGVDGLSAMLPSSKRDGITFLRPLLAISKTELGDFVEALGVTVVIDPTNENTHHARVRMRKSMSVLDSEGLSAHRLAETAARMARARAALDSARDAFLATHAKGHPTGFATFSKDTFADLPEEIGLRVLNQLCRQVGGRLYPAREERVVALHRALTAAAPFSGRTIAGCRIAPLGDGDQVLVCREGVGLESAVHVFDGTVWDNRFICTGHGRSDAPLTIGKLGRGGIQEARRSELGVALESVPGSVRPTLPALWHGRTLVGIPGLAVPQPGEIGLEVRFRGTGVPW